MIEKTIIKMLKKLRDFLLKSFVHYQLSFFFCLFSFFTQAQSPEISLREFASGQIKKGVRSLGMGGDGATAGNYSLVYRDSATALIDAGSTNYTNGNNFSFTALAAATPGLWHGLTIYALELSQNTNNIGLNLKYPAGGTGAIPVHGDGSNQVLLMKAAMPLGKGFSAGVLLSYEHSQFSAIADDGKTAVRYHTDWLPSGGLGVTYEPNKKIIIGFRALLNTDNETRTDNIGSVQGKNKTQEFRLGISYLIWKGGTIDIGGNLRKRSNDINNSSASALNPNIGFEQNLYNRHLAIRTGLDETAYTAGFSLRFHPIVLDVAYVNNLGIERVGTLFGTNSNSLIATFIFSYGKVKK